MTKPCGRPVLSPILNGQPVLDPTCQRPRMKGKQQCVWHWLLKQSADEQKRHAADRRENQLGHDFAIFQATVPKDRWPAGERWCAGCQSFVPLFYTTGSRCKSCASVASHSARVEKVYGITAEEYDQLLRLQGGRCFICQRKPSTKRLAVDHDHETGAVRGLLCASNEHGCNRAILGNIKDMAMARRILLYLARPPYERLVGLHKDYPALTWGEYLAQEAARLEREAQQEPVRVSGPPPPF